MIFQCCAKILAFVQSIRVWSIHTSIIISSILFTQPNRGMQSYNSQDQWNENYVSSHITNFRIVCTVYFLNRTVPRNDGAESRCKPHPTNLGAFASRENFIKRKPIEFMRSTYLLIVIFLLDGTVVQAQDYKFVWARPNKRNLLQTRINQMNRLNVLFQVRSGSSSQGPERCVSMVSRLCSVLGDNSCGECIPSYVLIWNI